MSLIPKTRSKNILTSFWPILTREPQDHIPWSSLLALPQSYIVPGGRFSETYYWDSYFTMLGLAESGREDLLKCMADNFAWMIEKLWPYSQRQPDLLSEPFAAAGFCPDG
ncbi:cytoplasmic trehalase [Salmonella enterica subsp. enterica]|uniref:Cytoplasmic trehalase n=1 Tax=Salmonella enterica I TaxID=59201 RepID=A0A3S4LQM8_SALET|nr:cytoplasmic trehalase [Salmonella enterica subsp. enterica]